MIAVTVTTHDIDFDVPKRIVRHVVSFDFKKWLKQIGVRWNWPVICFVLIQKYKTNNKMNEKGCHLWNMCFFLLRYLMQTIKEIQSNGNHSLAYNEHRAKVIHRISNDYCCGELFLYASCHNAISFQQHCEWNEEWKDCRLNFNNCIAMFMLRW